MITVQRHTPERRTHEHVIIAYVIFIAVIVAISTQLVDGGLVSHP